MDGVYSEGGEKIKEYNYDAYGNEIEQNPTDTNPYRYCSENYDTETGLIYLRARYYDPELGRFLTEDPVKDGLNWYVYCGNNPVNFVDPSGMKPIPQEAAAMAEHIYGDYNMKPEGKVSRTVAGWRLTTVHSGRESMKMGVYIPEGDNWLNPSEYAVVFRGTNKWFENYKPSSEFKNNVEAAFSENSADIWDAMNYGLGFVKAHQGKEITFVGHSKGGGEAIAAAAYTDRDAITFNAANFGFRNYLRDGGGGEITNYYVDGEILSGLIDRAFVGMSIMLDSYYNADIKWYDLPTVRDGKELYAAVQNHGMPAVIGALNRRK